MNKTFLSLIIILAAVIVVGSILGGKNGEVSEPLPESPGAVSDTILKLLPSFTASLYAKDLGNPRVMLWGPDGKMLVSVPNQGKVIALSDTDGDGFAETHEVVAGNLNKPHGLAERDGRLYIAETDQVAEYDYVDGKAVNKKKLFDLPGGGNHFSRTIMFMPYPNENKMLVSIGSSCNVCNESDERRAKILEYDFSTGKLAEFARGLRNSVFMAIHPVSGAIWATEMGRDNLGDDIPPDEINIISPSTGSGQSSVPNFGWPICYGKNIHDAEFDRSTYIRNPCMEPFEIPSYIDLQAHSAPLGLAFFPEEGWPEEYWYNLLVAYHGSWNRSVPTGYKIVRIKLNAKGEYLGTDSTSSPQAEDFITGWISGGKVYGRPVDIFIQPGGTIYISDDKAGVIYRVRYQETS
ncbi:MAG: PQQ-dependent sugar dehydrogenase [Patescibacteria group bacterium]